jgi:hypothetical protein
VVTTDATQTLTNKSISGAQIDSGTVAVARLGSGSPSASNFLRGDGSWQTVSTTPTTDQVLTAYAGAGGGAVGTYVFAERNAGAASIGSTIAGSNLKPADANYGAVGSALSGTWMLMGNSGGSGAKTLHLRIS